MAQNLANKESQHELQSSKDEGIIELYKQNI